MRSKTEPPLVKMEPPLVKTEPPAVSKPFSLRVRIESFGHAIRGVAIVLRWEQNAWIHALATLMAIALGFALKIDRGEWLAVSLAIALVWAAEILNTAIEKLSDVVSPEHHPGVKEVKDIAAGGVLVSAVGALTVAILVFGPRLLVYLP
ncbi:MAG: diacylglycerol kinase family protein [Myxococcota bacterium]